MPNALAPRKRPRTTLSPSLGSWDSTPWLAFGTPGGDQQDQWSLLLLLRMAHHGMTLQQAIDAPAFHTTRAPATASSPDPERPRRLPPMPPLYAGYNQADAADAWGRILRFVERHLH